MTGPILFDARKAADYGIGSYVRGLLGALAGGEHARRLLAVGPEAARALLPAPLAFVEDSTPNYSLGELVGLSRRARRLGAALYHAPHYVMPLALPCPAIVTVHDLIHLRHPEFLPGPLALLYARRMLPRAVRAAAWTITPTESVRRDLVVELGAESGRVVAIPNGVDDAFRAPLEGADLEAALAPLGLRPGYLLFVGNPKPHKNLDRLLVAYARVAGARRDLPQLLLVGARRESLPPLRRRLATLGLEERVRPLGYVDDARLPALYRGALALLFPTLVEGFGLPIAEAMASGTPVLVSDRPVHLEVAGDAAERVEPLDPDSIAAGLARLLDSPTRRQRMIERGRERAERYRWDRAAERTAELYREALAASATKGAG